MTIALVIAAVLGMLALVVAIAAVAHRHRAPVVDRFNHQALKRVVERHEKENQNLGRE